MFWLIFAFLVIFALGYPLLWIIVVPLGLWKAGQWYFYTGRPWRRIHYPLIRAYATAAGTESGEAQRDNREFDVGRALKILLRMTKPNWDATQITNFIDEQFSKSKAFDDRDVIAGYLRYKNPKLNKAMLVPVLDDIGQKFRDPDNGLKVRLIIAGIIEQQFGKLDRAEYLVEVMRGNAN